MTNKEELKPFIEIIKFLKIGDVISSKHIIAFIAIEEYFHSTESLQPLDEKEVKEYFLQHHKEKLKYQKELKTIKLVIGIEELSQAIVSKFGTPKPVEPKWPEKKNIEGMWHKKMTFLDKVNFERFIGYNEGRADAIQAWKESQG